MKILLYDILMVCNQSDSTGATSGARKSYSSAAPAFTAGFQWGSCYSIFSFMCNVLQIVVCPCVLFLLVIVLSVLLRITDSDYPFGIFKLFLLKLVNTMRFWNNLKQYISISLIIASSILNKRDDNQKCITRKMYNVCITQFQDISVHKTSGVRVTRSLVLYVYFVDRCLFFCTFSCGHCVVCSSSIYGF